MCSLDYTPVAVIPGFYAKAPLGNDFVKVAGSETEFTRPYRKSFLEFDRFCDAFHANDGEWLRPSFVFMSKKPATLREDGSALIAFRNIISLSITMDATRTKLAHGTTAFSGFQFSDNSDFFPWMLGKDLTNIYASNHVFMGFKSTDDFIGHAAPQIFTREIDAHSGDYQLREKLLDLWTESFVTSPRTSLLFRSFEMAYEASRLPPAFLHSDVDHGRLIALWISAFETLFHPGKTVNFETIQTALDRYPSPSQSFLKKSLTFEHKNMPRDCSIPQWLYKQLYYARNAYLHGNPVRAETLRPQGLKTALLHLAPLLYRLGVETFLTDIRAEKPSKRNLDSVGILTDRLANLEYEHLLEEYETALSGAFEGWATPP